MYRNKKIAALVPAYNEEKHIGQVIQSMPDFVDHLIIVNDGSTDGTGAIITATCDSRCQIITHNPNQGLGASLIAANLMALNETDADIMVILAGDNQMDPAYLPSLLDPIINGDVLFTKGNRFYSSSSFTGMPKHRVFGNIVLTFLTKLATGYWSVFDPQNGYTAISREASQKIDWNRVATDYAYENDILAHLSLQRAPILDIDIPAVYGSEQSTIKLGKVVPSLLKVLRNAFLRRFWTQYVIRSFSPVALFVLSGLPLILLSFCLGIWAVMQAIGPAEVKASSAVLTMLLFVTGFQLLLAGLVIDVLNEPKQR